jgi:dihydroorotate dehydrogenase
MLKPLLFLLDAETAHKLTFSIISFLQRIPPFLWLIKKKYNFLATCVAGLVFRNQVCIAAGLDKNAQLLPFWDALGVGAITIGTVTPKPQTGNGKPRLFRLLNDEALINRMGFNNDGMEKIYTRVKKFHTDYPVSDMQIGISIGPNAVSVENSKDAVLHDYVTLFEKFCTVANFFEINVSSPNTPGLRDLQEDEFLALLFEEFKKIRPRTRTFLKISPDLELNDFYRLVKFVNRTENCSGLVVANTTTSRTSLKKSYTPQEIEHFGKGGLSGPMLFDKMSERVSGATDISNKPIIAVGGICSPERAQEVLQNGASLIQIYTGLVYEGPRLIKNILNKLKSSK